MGRNTAPDPMLVPLFVIFLGLIVITAVFSLSLILDLPCTPDDHVIVVPNQKSDCAFLFMLSSNAYFPCLSVAIHSLQETGTKKDIVVMVTPNIWENVNNALRSMGVNVVEITAVSNPSKKPKRHHLTDNFTKLRAWQLAEYKKIVYTDADFIYTRNSDDLCELPSAVNAGRNYVTLEKDWSDPNFFNAGFMIITPSVDTFCKMYDASRTFDSPTGGDQPFQNEYWKNAWHEIDYKYDGANANIYFNNYDEWDKNRVRSIHFTRSTNPCNHRFEDDIQEKWDEFDLYGRPKDYNPLVLWLEAKESLINDYPEFEELFNQCGFMLGWDDGGNAGTKEPIHPLGFL